MKTKCILFCVFCCCLYPGLVISARAQNDNTLPTAKFDIGGIFLGGSLNEAVARIKAQNERVQVLQFTAKRPGMSALISSDESSDTGFVIHAIDGKIVRIQHLAMYKDGAEPNTGDTIKGLIAKYGAVKKSQVSPDGAGRYTDIVWGYGPHREQVYPGCGSQTTPIGSPEGLLESTNEPPVGISSNWGTPALITGIDLDDGCATHVSVRVAYAHDRNLLNTVNVMVEDDTTIKEYFKRLDAAAKQQPNRALQKSHENKAVY